MHPVEELCAGPAVSAEPVPGRPMLERSVYLTRVNHAAALHKFQHRLRLLPARAWPFLACRPWMHKTLRAAWKNTVVDEKNPPRQPGGGSEPPDRPPGSR